MGITSPLSRNLSMALGTSGVTLQELVRAYGVLANEGKRVQPFFIKKIVDRTGHVFEETQPKVEQVIDPRIAFMTSYVMQDVVESGTGQRVKKLGRPVAGKTGTTDDTRDAWFMGFTPSLVAGVWVGFDQERSLGQAGSRRPRRGADLALFCGEGPPGDAGRGLPRPGGDRLHQGGSEDRRAGQALDPGGDLRMLPRRDDARKRPDRRPCPPPRRRLQVRPGPQLLKYGTIGPVVAGPVPTEDNLLGQNSLDTQAPLRHTQVK